MNDISLQEPLLRLPRWIPLSAVTLFLIAAPAVHGTSWLETFWHAFQGLFLKVEPIRNTPRVVAKIRTPKQVPAPPRVESHQMKLHTLPARPLYTLRLVGRVPAGLFAGDTLALAAQIQTPEDFLIIPGKAQADGTYEIVATFPAPIYSRVDWTLSVLHGETPVQETSGRQILSPDEQDLFVPVDSLQVAINVR